MLEWFDDAETKRNPDATDPCHEIGSDRWIDSVSDGLGEEGTAEA